MSKSDDDAASEMEEGMTTAERRRRRRRGAGLRIPSDNVPRRAGSQEVIAPVPEDPALAVSIAYAFNDDPSSSQRMRVDDLSDVDDLEDLTTIAAAHGQPPAGQAEVAAGSMSGAHSLVSSGLVEDVVADGRTRQMAAMSLEALGLTDPDPGADDGGDVISGTNEAVEIEVDDDEDDDNGANGHGEPAQLVAPVIPPPRVRASTVPPAAPPVRVTFRTEAIPTPAAVPEEVSDLLDDSGRATTDREADREDGVIRAPQNRAHTVALSEDDLEELLEMTPPPRLAPNPPPANAPAVAGRARTADPHTLADNDVHEVVAPADASDSGEILAEEIVDDEELARAPAVAAAPPVPAAAPAGHKPPTPPPAAPAAKRSATRAAAAAAAAASPADAETRKKRRGKPWFEEVFDEDYLRTLPFLTPQATQAEALMVIESLGVQPGASVLDVGCGYGRHAMELAARGFHVVGVDLSLPLLLRGADEAQRRGLDINFVHADMREMDFDAQFDGAYCLFSTFGYFDDETNKKTATLVAKALKPGAKIMLEVLNRDYVIGDLPTRVWWEGDGCVVLEEVEFNYFSSRVQSKRSVVFDDGRQVEQEISVRVYSLHEIGKLLHAAGFRVLEVSGSMATRGRFLGNRSREIIVVAERRHGGDASKTLT